MSAGRSSSDRGRALVAAIAVAATAAVTPVPAAPAAAEAAAPAAAAPPAPEPVSAGTSAPRRPCPRCGYAGEAGWSYCVRCGWDRSILTGQAAESMLESTGRGVVGVSVTRVQTIDPEFEKLLARYRVRIDRAPARRAYGTAFALRPGLFVTAAALIDDASEVSVRGADNRTVTAGVVAVDRPSGIGVLKADLPGAAVLTPAAVAAVGGDALWAVCAPVSIEPPPVRLVRYLPQSLHLGRLGGTGETGTNLVAFENLLRSDHSLPWSCSGGALVDARGGVAGMVVASPDTGLTYGVPIAGIVPIFETLAQGQPPRRPYFGIGLLWADERRRAWHALPKDPGHPLIAYVIPGSPAAAAGLRAGDLLEAVDGSDVGSVKAAADRLLAASPEAPASLAVGRAGEHRDIRVTPVARPRQIMLAPIDELRESLQLALVEVATGPTAQHGLRVTDIVPGGRGESDGFRRGDLILSVNKKRLRTFQTFDVAVRDANPRAFAADATDDRAGYYVRLEVRPEGKTVETRPHWSLFPSTLQPPVY